MYESYFGLKEKPFSIAPNPHYLYMSKQHREALAHLIYGVEREGGFVLLTGEVGTGKTTICRCFLEQVPDNADVAFILNPKLDSTQLLAAICDELSLPYIDDSFSIKGYTDCIYERLLTTHSKGRHTVLIIDEAQNLSIDVLEQLRLLTNLETYDKKLLQIILLGQPELQDVFLKPEMEQLSQRVTARFHMTALNKDEMASYVSHRLSIAGSARPDRIFNEKSLQKLYQISKGIPRLINLICDRSLLGAYVQNQKQVTPAIVSIAAKEVLGKKNTDNTHKSNSVARFSPSATHIALVGLLVAVFSLGASLSSYFVRTELPAAAIPDLSTIPTPPTASLPTVIAKPVATSTGNGEAQDFLMFELPELLAAQSPLLSSPAPTENQLSSLFDESLAGFSKQAAYNNLLESWLIDYDEMSDGMVCDFVKHYGFECLSRLGSLGTISHIDSPAVLKLFDADAKPRFVLLRNIHADTARLFVGSQEITVSITELVKYWRGHFVILWRRPSEYVAPLNPGTVSPLTKWLSQQLNIYEGHPNSTPGRSFYDDELVERVKLFQQNNGEVADGIVGINTLIQLSKINNTNRPTLFYEKRT